MSEAAARCGESARTANRPLIPASERRLVGDRRGRGGTRDSRQVVGRRDRQAVAAAVGRLPLRPTGSPRAATWADAGSADDGHGHGEALGSGGRQRALLIIGIIGYRLAYGVQTNRQPLAQTAAAKTALTSSLGELPPTESFSTEGFRAEAHSSNGKSQRHDRARSVVAGPTLALRRSPSAVRAALHG